MAGSAVGGFVAVVFGRDTVFILNSLTFVVSALFLRRMQFDEPHLDRSKPFRLREAFNFSPMLEGFRYVRGDARLLATLLVKAGLGLLGAHWVILPIFGERIFPLNPGNLDPQRAGMLGISVLMGSRGIGALMGPFIGGYWAGRDRARLRTGILTGFFAVSIGYTALGFAPNILLAVMAVVLANMGGSVIWVFSTTLLHLQAANRFRGRVFSADFGFLVLTMSLVSSLSGVAVDHLVPVRTISIITGVVALTPAALWALVAMPLWRESK
jgi:MFS family permease